MNFRPKGWLFVFLFISSGTCIAQLNPGPGVNKVELTVNTNEIIYPIHSDFWGANFLNWVDDDAALANGKISAFIKAANIKVLRFPGGTVADNYHWKSNTLENVNMFPFESGTSETDFDEFMQQCKKIGAMPAVVLNTETWAVKKDIAAGAHEAAEWLRYSMHKGYKVKYWEIGNETYWHPIMTADEYADLINVYADTLKRIEPNIILGANGHWNTEFVGTKERLKNGASGKAFEYRSNITDKDSYKRYDDYVKENTRLPITSGSNKWWETVVRKSGKNVDMIIVHWYFAPNQLPMVTKKLTEVKKLFTDAYPGKKFLLNISEYNVTEKTPESHMHMTEMIGAMLTAGTDITGLWPMRLKYKKPTLFNYEADQTSNLYQIHKRLSTQLTGSLVQTISSEQIPAFASYNSKSASIVLTGSKIDKASPVQIKLIAANSTFQTCTVWRIGGTEFNYKVKEEVLSVKGNTSELTVNPSEVIIATFR